MDQLPQPPAPPQQKPISFQKLEATFNKEDLKGEAFLCDLSCLNSTDFKTFGKPQHGLFINIVMNSLLAPVWMCPLEVPWARPEIWACCWATAALERS